MNWAELHTTADLAIFFVAQTATDDPTILPWAPGTVWEACPDEVSQGWVKDNGTYRAFLPEGEFANMPFEVAVEAKSKESEQYAQALIDIAYSTPQQGVIADPGVYKRRTESRRNDAVDKMAGEIALTQEEKDQAKLDQKLSEYETKCWTASDKVLDNIDKETTTGGVMAIDVPTNTLWPIWASPSAVAGITGPSSPGGSGFGHSHNPH